MIRSLIPFLGQHDHVYVFCFDDKTLEVITTLKLPHVIPVALAEFETPGLLAVKGGRTKGEYCWTSTPHVLLHVLKNRGEKECTYLDADLYFYQSPEAGLPSGGKSVLITEHRYTPKFDQTDESGRFCVQFVTFQNKPDPMRLLEKWGNQCLDWCYNRVEDGKFGDQKYLDAWPAAGDFVEISGNRWLGVAPWNIQQFAPEEFKPVFYHFHGVHWYEQDQFFLGGYPLQAWAIDQFYRPYLKRLCMEAAQLKEDFGVEFPLQTLNRFTIKQILKRIIFRKRYITV